jgi:serine protease Do
MRPRWLGASLLLASFVAAGPSWAQPQHPAALPPAQKPAVARTAPTANVEGGTGRGGPAAKAPPSGTTELRKLGDAFADVAERVSPSVVQIDVTTGDEATPLRWIRADGAHRGLGSGVIFSPDGAVLTNNHVIEEARAITVRLRDGRMFPARLVGRDPSTDLAVLRIDGKDLQAANFGNSEAARVGEWVLAIGSPFGLGHTVTTGVLSAKGRGGVGMNAVEDYLQTDASINPGNSGGPLVNLDGKVLGINTMIVSRGQGIGLAVPASIARRVADQIIKTGRVDRAYIGLGLQDLTPQLAAAIPAAPQYGALVNSVNPNGPAHRARLEPGDVIYSFGGKQVRDAQDIIREVFIHAAGETVAVDFVRKGSRSRVNVTLDSRRDPAPPALPIERRSPPQPGLGLQLRDVTGAGEAQKPIAVVASVSPDSPADRAGIKGGDVILEADGARQPTAAQVQHAAQDGSLLLRVRRQGSVFYAALQR